ncbi:MAG: hypothetical protein AAGA06_00195 [Pseudomonadota bacterium]
MNGIQLPITYEVTISEELRELRRVAHASEVASMSDHQGTSNNQTHCMLDVFSDLSLRVDGRRPLRVVASEILVLEVGKMDQWPAAKSVGSKHGYACVRLLLTEGGTCLAHVSALPGPDSSERPLHRIGEMLAPSDMMVMVQRCRAEFQSQWTQRFGPAASAVGNPKQVLEPQFDQLVKNLVPFVETPLN